MTNCPCPRCGKHSGRWKNQHIKAEPTLCDACYEHEEAIRIKSYHNDCLTSAKMRLSDVGFTPEQITALDEWFDAKENCTQ